MPCVYKDPGSQARQRKRAEVQSRQGLLYEAQQQSGSGHRSANGLQYQRRSGVITVRNAMTWGFQARGKRCAQQVPGPGHLDARNHGRCGRYITG